MSQLIKPLVNFQNWSKGINSIHSMPLDQF